MLFYEESSFQTERQAVNSGKPSSLYINFLLLLFFLVQKVIHRTFKMNHGKSLYNISTRLVYVHILYIVCWSRRKITNPHCNKSSE